MPKLESGAAHLNERRRRDDKLQYRQKNNGDGVFVITPVTCKRAATASAWTRIVEVAFRTKDGPHGRGKLHAWYSGSLASGVSIAKVSTSGTVTIASTTLTFKGGKAIVVISGTGTWLAAETDTLTIAAATINGKSVATVTSTETIT